MTLDQLVKWAKEHGVPMDKHISFGVPLCSPKAVRYDLAHGVFVLIPAHEYNSKIQSVCIDCLCTPDSAKEVLETSNWNIPLAIITYLRIRHGNQDPTEVEARQEACQGSEEGSG